MDMNCGRGNVPLDVADALLVADTALGRNNRDIAVHFIDLAYAMLDQAITVAEATTVE